MIFFVIAIILSIGVVLFLLLPIKRNKKPNNMHCQFLEKTTSIKWRGFFAIGVLLTHYWAQISFYDEYPNVYVKIASYLIRGLATYSVNGFFVLSTYGFLKSTEAKKNINIKQYLMNKLINIYIPFVIANMFHIMILTGIFNEPCSLFLDLIGIGYCNDTLWYIYEIMVWYIIFALTFVILRNVKKTAYIIIVIDIFSFAIMYIMNVGGVWYWSNFGIMCGALLFLYSEQIINVVNKYSLCICSISFVIEEGISYVVEKKPIFDPLRIFVSISTILAMVSFNQVFEWGGGQNCVDFRKVFLVDIPIT